MELKAKLNFIENELPKLMQTALKGQKIISCLAESKSQLDGFMSSIFTVRLVTQDDNEQ